MRWSEKHCLPDRVGHNGIPALMVSPWDFRLQDIRSAVYLWHGEEDANAPLAMGHYMAATIPNSHASFYPGEGHLSLMAKHVEEILKVVARAEPSRSFSSSSSHSRQGRAGDATYSESVGFLVRWGRLTDVLLTRLQDLPGFVLVKTQ